MQELVEKLERIVGVDNVLVNEPMSAHTTFKIGGPADAMVVPHALDEILKVVRLCHNNEVELRIIGCGSDLLVSDAGLRCVVMKIADNFAGIRVLDDGTVMVQAGATNAAVAEAVCEAGFAGYEFACGIPGTIGGAAIMNAGAYDGCFADVAESVNCLTPDGHVVCLQSSEAEWGYRQSLMDRAGLVVLTAVLKLTPDSPEAIRARMDELNQRRADKQPLELPSAGSTFKRPEGYFADKLIQDAGMQGHRVGGAEVSRKHAGFIVNADGATASDVRQVIADVQDAVRTQFGVELEPEVRMWGF